MRRVRNVLEITALDKDLCRTCGGNAISTIVEVIVVIDVGKECVPHSRMTLSSSIEPIVMISYLEMAGVLGTCFVRGAEKAGLVVIVKMVPRDGDIVGRVADIESTVFTIGDVAVVNPDVVSIVLDKNTVPVSRYGFEAISDGQVFDDDIVARMGAIALDAQFADDAWIGTDADDSPVWHDVNAGGEGDSALNLNDIWAEDIHISRVTAVRIKG
jgi:hypothetical protein